ncbi:class I SAM-dependent rRNA methyltransferase [Parendozoicomonas haliclonae]|uniref:Ribosomal RNA large subunit methyltransferase I n=1 Tax=Parendozoicomonas haliclonae TaxID=1960125 RepID=A0A1X7AE53_9GAMM|nr:class I SAM-dependent rRNA methyltransferase [Parendozoicomonas haliclonae]SMA31927.1 Ribosomal RNA large subunit methyltransferase I [Parendozoicomonas haliclonae]
MNLTTVRLKKNADRRIKAGHLWIYSNEIDTAATPLTALTPGQQAVVESSTGKALGIAYFNPNTLICGRLISRDTKHALDASLLVHRIKIALSLRERLFPEPCYRLIYGDSDNLPGLVVDRFHDYLVVQIGTIGMELMRDEIVEALVKVLKPTGILLRNNGGARTLEGLPEYIEEAYGTVPDELPLVENNTQFLAPVRTGQKTGWFYDHRPARAWLNNIVKGQRVLDVFSYIGGWGVQAANHGASEVFCVDSSPLALEYVHKNAELNGVGDKVATMEGDAFAALKELHTAQERFDIVVVDPPAFIKRKKDIRNGEQAYRRINEMAMRLLGQNGILVSGSCSMHLQRDSLTDILRASARHIDREIQLFAECHQGADHPIHPAIPETAYIKAMFGRVLRV